MAHSYISVNNSITERTICATDSILHVFMYFFSTVLKDRKLNIKEQEIYNHYDLELVELHTSYINLKLNEIYGDDKLKSWYLLMLDEVKLLMNPYGEFIDNNYLNSLPKLNKEYSRPIPVEKLKNLINDLMWLLNKRNVYPSEDYKWMESPIDHKT